MIFLLLLVVIQMAQSIPWLYTKNQGSGNPDWQNDRDKARERCDHISANRDVIFGESPGIQFC